MNNTNGVSGIGGYYSIEFYRDYYHDAICNHCKKVIKSFDYILPYSDTERGKQHMNEVFCFCNFTQSQIKEIIDKNNKL